MLAVALALASSVAYGISDFLGGLKGRSVPLLAVLLISQGTALVVLAITALAFTSGPPGGSFLLYAAIAGLGEAVGVAALYRGLAVGVMSIVAPVAATAPVVPVIVGLTLGELPSPVEGAGIGLAALGIAATACDANSAKLGQPRALTSVAFGALTALGFGTFYVAMDAASEGEIPWALLVARLTAVGIFGATALLTRERLAVGRAHVPVIAAIGVLIIVADSLYAAASREGLLAVVAALSSLYPIITIALARLYLDERISAQQRIGIAVSLGGAVAIAAG